MADGMEKFTVGSEKVSITLYRKTEGDLIVSQLSMERWFADGAEAERAMKNAIFALLARPNGAIKDGGIKKP